MDNSITTGTTYYYIILPIYSFGTRFNSTEITGMLPTISSVPTLSVTAGNRSVYLSWTAPFSNGGSTIDHYQLYRGSLSGQYTLLSITKNLYFNDTVVSIGTAYYYVVTAVNGVVESPYSTELSATPFGIVPTVPKAPTLQVTAGNQTAYLSWTAPDDGGSPILEYQIFRGTLNGEYSFVSVTTHLSFNNTMLSGGTEYFYVVAAVNAIGKGYYSIEQSVTPFGPSSLNQIETLTITQIWKPQQKQKQLRQVHQQLPIHQQDLNYLFY